MKVTRRQVLAATAAMAAAGALGVGATAVRWWDQPAGEQLQALSPGEHGFVQALAEAWMPPGGDPPISGAEAGMGDFLDAVVARMAEQQGRLFRVLLHALDEETLPTHLARFSTLDLTARQDVLRGWLRSPWFLQRQAIGAVLALISFGYTEHPEVAPMVRPFFPCGFGS